MVETCVVIAKLIGILNTQPVNVYKLDCMTSNTYIVIEDKSTLVVDVKSINSDLSYNVVVKDVYENKR